MSEPYKGLNAALARSGGPSAEDVEALAGVLSGAAPEYVALAIPTHIEQAKRLLASDWFAAHTAAAEARGAERERALRRQFYDEGVKDGARAVVEAVARMVAEWGEVVPPLDPPSAAASILAAAREAAVRVEGGA